MKNLTWQNPEQLFVAQELKKCLTKVLRNLGCLVIIVVLNLLFVLVCCYLYSIYFMGRTAILATIYILPDVPAVVQITAVVKTFSVPRRQHLLRRGVINVVR